jgi:DNA mismatch repair protein MutL
VVKELTENAVDAGATRVDVSVQQGGLELIRVADNGSGISPEELPLAVASHATSKIATAEDLFQVGTLGFRGEALASIAEISRFLIRSRTPDSPAGAELEVTGGTAREVAPCGCPIGTVIEVQNLFYNTPVRRKFMRTTQTEMGHATEAFTRLALAFPQVHFTLKHNERVQHELPPTTDWRERIANFFGDELADGLIWVQDEHDGVRLSGYVANPTHSRSHNRMQYLFLNGRHIRDRALQHALTESYRGLLLTGRYPVCFLRLEMPPDLVDVNVHPTKLEVRFQDSGRVYSQLLGTLRTKFLTADLTARLDPRGSSQPTGGDFTEDEQAAAARRELVDWAKGEIDRQRGESAAGARDSFAPHATAPQSPGYAQQAFAHASFAMPGDRPPLSLQRIDGLVPPAQDWQAAEAGEQSANAPAGYRPVEDAPDSAGLAAARSFVPRPHVVGSGSSAALQVHNKYLVAETDEGLVVIDQHALHERILYEQLREKVLGEALETQQLLVPEPVDLSPEETAAVLQQSELLSQLGLRVEPFGGDTVLVSSYPAMLANFRPAEVLRDLAEQLLVGGKSPDRRDLLDSLLHMISCKAAIKAGDRLTAEEITALLDQQHLAQDAHHCPHGRPTALVFTRDELDRQFKRI